MTLPNGFIESKNYGKLDLAIYGVGYWSRKHDAIRSVSEMTTTANTKILVANCLVGRLLDIASDKKVIDESQKPYYDDVFYSLVYLYGTGQYSNISQVQSPKFDDIKIVYEKMGDRRVWAIASNHQNQPLLIRIAQAPKSREHEVYSVISSDNRKRS